MLCHGTTGEKTAKGANVQVDWQGIPDTNLNTLYVIHYLNVRLLNCRIYQDSKRRQCV